MPRLIVIEGHQGQRRQLSEQLAALGKKGYALLGKFEAGERFTSWRALFENAESRGLFEERQVLVSESSEALGPFPDELIPSLEDENKNENGDEGAASVIIATFSGDTKKFFSKELLALKKILFLKGEAAVPPWKRKDWLLNLAREKKLSLAPDAAALLGEFIESQEELRSALDLLGTYADGEKISVQDVRALSFDEGSRAQLTFLDGVCRANARDAASGLKYLKRDAMLPVLTALCNRLRPALYLATFPGSQDEALKAIGVGAGKNYSLQMAKNALAAFGARAIQGFMLRAARLSFLEKTSRSEGWPGFELILWDLMDRTGKSKNF